jgi:hypothetical protein
MAPNILCNIARMKAWTNWITRLPFALATVACSHLERPSQAIAKKMIEVSPDANVPLTCSVYVGDVGQWTITLGPSEITLIEVGYLRAVLDRRNVVSKLQLTNSGEKALKNAAIHVVHIPPYSGGPVVESWEFDCASYRILRVIDAVPSSEEWSTIDFIYDLVPTNANFSKIVDSSPRKGVAEMRWSSELKVWQLSKVDFGD